MSRLAENFQVLRSVDISHIRPRKRGKFEEVRRLAAMTVLDRGLPVDGTKIPYGRLQELRQANIRAGVLDHTRTADDLLRLEDIAAKGHRLARDFGVADSDGITFERLQEDILERLVDRPAYQSAITFFGSEAVAQEVQLHF